MSTAKRSASATEAEALRLARVNTVPAQDVKRRGVRAIIEKLERGPVHILQHNRPTFVALSEESYQLLVSEIEETRLRASLDDVEAGRVRFASPREMIDELIR